jgi:hypothetical protein
VYLYNTEDSSSVEFYDCISDYGARYCRRPLQSIVLQRDQPTWHCHYKGISHSFASLMLKNISVSTILHQWKSSVEKVEEYSRYRRQRQSNELVHDGKYLCECTDPQSFGKNCEYLLPTGTTFQETLNWEVEMIKNDSWPMQIHGDIVCYTTLICDSGLLCLDWRDICDGVQQCMFGYDEENCDMFEFNECEDDEYRCVNGMCIPDEYFLDGEFDCSDLSDEKESFSDSACTFHQASYECDDRMCPRHKWSCGDGQCISDRLHFQNNLSSMHSQCNSLRDQYYMCETKRPNELRQWTLPSGKCSPSFIDKGSFMENLSNSEQCSYFMKYALLQQSEKNCSYQHDYSCANQLMNPCPCNIIQYPNGRILAPYAFSWYNATGDWSQQIPDYISINGTIKCRGYLFNGALWTHYPSEFRLHSIEKLLCIPKPIGTRFSTAGYDKFCHNNARTFNNLSYHFHDVCKQSEECISAYRIEDASEDCDDGLDEEQTDIVSTTCSNVQRHRFRCSIEQPTCLPVTALDNLLSHCQNIRDEFWTEIKKKMSKAICNGQSKDDCDFIRQYVELSGKNNTGNSSHVQLLNKGKISFRTYCDTFWNQKSMKDEIIGMCKWWWICLEKQWKCRTGQCIEPAWVLDHEWDCADASDEEALFVDQNAFLTQNLRLVSKSVLQMKYEKLYTQQPFQKICNLNAEYPCFRIDASDPLNITLNRPCINLTQIGDGTVDCVGAWDEHNMLEHCSLPSTLGYYFKCPSDETCVELTSDCQRKCYDSRAQCYGFKKNSFCSNSSDFLCLNGRCIPYGWRCDGDFDCFHGEDEYMCIRQQDTMFSSLSGIYREEKERNIRKMQQNLQLRQFPIITNKIEVTDTISSKAHNVSRRSSSFDQMPSSIAYWCNRGVGILLHNATTVCFCPPQYYGDKCQFHNDRLTVLFHLNLTQSIYTKSHNYETVLKILIIFLYEDQPLMTDYFHTRPADEAIVYKKTMNYLFYSRSTQLLQHKRARYFNRSYIIEKHPYSVRIEAYELNKNEKARLAALWLYPIYFDFLPSFRLVKVLRWFESHVSENPCRSSPCSAQQKCHQVLNQKSTYVCLCSSHFKERDCLIMDEMCKDSYCSIDALCKPDYRGLLSGNERPYCICPLNKFGQRCDLIHDKCDPNPCQNDGTCFATSELNNFFCLCNDRYYGEKCEVEKPAVRLYINESVNHRGAVVQYFSINFYSLDLVLVHQQIFVSLPHDLFYLHTPRKAAPDIIIVKLYSNLPVRTYLISVQINVQSINGMCQVSEKTLCAPVHTLFAPGEGMSKRLRMWLLILIYFV